MPSSSTDVLNFVKRSCHCTALSLIHNRLLCSQFSSCAVGYNRSFFVRRVSLSGVAGGFYGALGARCSLPGLGLALICRTAAAVRALATRQLHRAPKRATRNTKDQKLWQLPIKVFGKYIAPGSLIERNRPFHKEARKLERKMLKIMRSIWGHMRTNTWY